MEPILVQTTFEQKEDAQTLATLLLEKRLIACAQIVGPVTSLYWWKKQIDQAEELILIMKSHQANYARLEQEIIQHHPYETPEIIVMPVVQGSNAYLSWLNNELKQ
ncbi:MAG: divalent-cation tolerance protein CutA [Desulfobulbaceae bacterium]|uniref:Divalent-cation tolerance protein CutA n=1 Tax=Candidatus Desulfatifera sulfidica TaxID=2841691 RepID=A0A8J6N5R9_9BACT|nr:divalent-cation tolerance protein CutA [Candidatus Desulfatifera sulfidica]